MLRSMSPSSRKNISMPIEISFHFERCPSPRGNTERWALDSEKKMKMLSANEQINVPNASVSRHCCFFLVAVLQSAFDSSLKCYFDGG